MKQYLIIILTTISFSVAGQKNIYLYFNDAGFCGPGPLIMEQMTLFEDNSFEYTSSQYPNIRIEASGRFSRENKNMSLQYDLIKIDTLDKSKVKSEITSLHFISEFKIIEDKEWLENKAGMLIECGKAFGSNIKAIEPRKKRIVTTKTIDYKLGDKLPAANSTYTQ